MRRTHPTPINFVFLFPKQTDGQLSLQKIQIVCTLYSLTSPRIEKLKFSYFGTYEQSYVGLYLFDNPYERIIFQTVEAECSSHTESIWLKYLFSQTSFMYVKPRIISERSRCFLVIFSASYSKTNSAFLDDSRFFLLHKLLVSVTSDYYL